jgi:hypothetical protein
MTLEVKTMIDNLEPAVNSGACSPPSVGAIAPSCYRVSVLSGSLEVSARLKNADDLELLMKVLEANKVLFTRVVPTANEDWVKADRSGTNSATSSPAKVHSSEIEVLAKPERSGTKSLAKAPRTAKKASIKADQFEPEVLILT